MSRSNLGPNTNKCDVTNHTKRSMFCKCTEAAVCFWGSVTRWGEHKPAMTLRLVHLALLHGGGVTVHNRSQKGLVCCVQIISFKYKIRNREMMRDVTCGARRFLVDDFIHRGLLVSWTRHDVLIVRRDVAAQHGRGLLRLGRDTHTV